MRTITTLLLVFVVSVATAQVPLSDIYGSRAGGSPEPAVPAAPGITQQATGLLVLDEGFDDNTTLPGAGWVQINNSDPLGITNWFQGNDGVFSAYDGSPIAYIAANFNNTIAVGTISNWLISPQLTLNNGDYIRFYTRTAVGSIWPDRLELRLSTAGSSSDVGSDATSVGDFTTLLLSVNPTLQVSGYPESWTAYEVQLTGLSGTVTGRFALRYFVTDGAGLNGNYIGIDRVQYYSNPIAAQVPLNNLAIVMGFVLILLFSAFVVRRIL